MKTFLSNQKMLVALVALFAATGLSASAQIILSQVDLGSTTVQSGWTGAASGSSLNGGIVNLTFPTETAGTASVTLTNGTTDWIRDRGALATNTTPIGYSDLYRDFYKSGGASTPITLSFTGLTASTAYSFTFYAFDKSNAGSVATPNTMAFFDTTTGSNVALGTIATTGQPVTDNQWSLTVTRTTNALGALSFSEIYGPAVTVPDGGPYTGFNNQAILNGFIVSTVAAVPEPSTWALMLSGLAMLGFVLRTRRRSQS